MTNSSVKRGDRRSRLRPTKYEIFDQNMAIAWEESVLYEPRKIDYVPEGDVLKILMEENPEFSEEEIQISFRKLNKEAERIFEENKEMMEADEPVQQEVMFWGSMAELDKNETVYDREIKVWLLEHPPSQCTRKRPAPKKEQKTTGTLSNLTEEEKAARVSDLVDSVSKGETSQEYTPDSFPTLSVLGMVLDDEIPPKVRKIPPKEGIPPKDQKKSHPRKDPLFPLKQKSIPMLLAGAQIGGPQDGPTVAEYLRIKLFAGRRRSNDPRVLASNSNPNSGSVQALGSGFGHQMTNGPIVAGYPNHNLSAGGPGPASGSGSALGSGLVLGSVTCSSSGPTPGTHTKEPEEDPNQDQSPQAINSDSRPQESDKNLEKDRDTLETSDSGPQDDSQAKKSEISQEDLDASRLAAGYQDFGPQYDDDGVQNYFDPCEEQEDFVLQGDSVSQAQEDEDPTASGLGRMPAEDNEEDMELQEDFVPQNDSGSQAQENEDPEASGSGRMPSKDDREDMELQEDVVPQNDSGSQAQEDEDPEASGLAQMPAEDNGEDMGLQEEVSDSDGHNSSSSGVQNGSQTHEGQSSNASGSGQMPVEDVEMDSGSDLDENHEDGLRSLADAQRLRGTESSGTETETSGSGAVSEMAAEHQNPMAHKDEDLEPEDENEASGAQNDVLLQDRQEDQETPKRCSGYHNLVPDQQEPQEDFEPEDDHQDQEPGSDPETKNNDHGHQDKQGYVPEEGEEDWELREEIELQEVQEPEPFGPVFGLFEDQDRELQRAHIELQDQEYQDPNLPEPEREPGRLSPERGTYSGIPVWEMYQRAKKMFEDLRKAALESSGSDLAEESSSAEEEEEEAEERVSAEEAIIVDEHEERGKQN